MSLIGLRTGLSVPGAIDSETMIFFVEELLAPTLKRGEVVFFDNCQIHKAEEIAEAIEAQALGRFFCQRIRPTSIRLKTVGQK